MQFKGKNFYLFLVLGFIITGIIFSKGEITVDAASKEKKAVGENPRIEMTTSLGNIELELDSQKAPITVANFLHYVDRHFYDGTIFHRVIANFMIQGGGFTHGMKEKATEKEIKNEAGNGLSNKRGTIAMARTQVIDSATSQFFINVVDNDFLNHQDNSASGFGYCVFGKVVHGMDVVDKIKAVHTKTAGFNENVPVEDVVIVSIKRVEK